MGVWILNLKNREGRPYKDGNNKREKKMREIRVKKKNRETPFSLDFRTKM